MQFAKADPKQARIKIAIYGPPGSGKSFTSLLLAEGLANLEKKRIAYVDTEHGTDFYAKRVPERAIHPEPFDFDAIYTRSLSDVLDAVKDIDPAVYSVVVLDSVSHLWDAAMEAYTGKRTRADTIPMNAWGAIKKPYKSLIRFMVESPMHGIIDGRQKNIFSDENGEMRKEGVTMRAESETPYETHLCIRMETKKGDKDSTVYAYVEKDRTGILSGKIIPNPSFQTFAPILPLLGTEQFQTEDPDEVALRDSELLNKEDDKDRKKQDKSSSLYADFNAALAGASTMEALGVVAEGLKKQRRYMTEGHLAGLRVLYEERRKVVTAALAPEGV